MAFGPGRQPKGFAPQDVEATLLDPRTKDLHGVPAGEHEECWALLTTRLIPFITAVRATSSSSFTSSASIFGGHPSETD